MKLQEGPLFGALIIGIGLAAADYIFLSWIKKFTKK